MEKIDKELFKKSLGSELIGKLKEALKFSTVEVKLEEVELKDGNFLVVEKKEVGAKAEIKTAEGTMVAMDGEYLGLDGAIYMVSNGMISEMKPKVEEPKADEPKAETATDLTAIEAKLSAITSSFEAKFEAIKKENLSVKIELSETKKHLATALNAVNKIIETPVTSSVEHFSGVPKKEYHEMSNLEKVKHNRGLL